MVICRLTEPVDTVRQLTWVDAVVPALTAEEAVIIAAWIGFAISHSGDLMADG